MRRLLTAALLVSGLVSGANADELEQRGRNLLTRLCADCHAIGRTGSSRHPAAPTFRSLEQRLDIDSINERLREGLSSSHRDMPMFRFTRDDARAARAYLRSIQD